MEKCDFFHVLTNFDRTTFWSSNYLKKCFGTICGTKKNPHGKLDNGVFLATFSIGRSAEVLLSKRKDFCIEGKLRIDAKTYN